jgi:ABC-type transport system involved in multi-copper enzyme maturation permease subunit
MSITGAAAEVAPVVSQQGRPAGLGHILLSEWTKIRSVRSTIWSLIIYVVLALGLTGLLCWLTVHAMQTGRAPRRGSELLADPASFILGTGLSFGQLAIVVLGVLVMTTEYSTGVIRASLLAVPRRLLVLAAKCAVFAMLIFVIAEIVSFCSFFIGAAIVHPEAVVSLSQPNVTRAVIGTGLYLTVLGLFALSIGALIRHSAGAIAAAIGLVLVVGPILGLLDSYSWGKHVHDWFPTVAGSYIVSVHQTSDQVLSPWQGFAVFCGWTALLLIIGGYVLRKRDA